MTKTLFFSITLLILFILQSGTNVSAQCNGQILVNQMPSDTFCFNTGETITLSAPNGQINYFWSEVGTQGTAVIANPLNQETIVNASQFITTFRCRMTGKDNLLCDLFVTLTWGMRTFQVIPDALTLCQGQTATLKAFGADTYLWNDGATTAEIVIKPQKTGNYTVAAARNNCIENATVKVTVVPLPSLLKLSNGKESSGKIKLCPDGSVRLEVADLNDPQNSAYEWSPLSSNESTLTVSASDIQPATSKTFQVIVTNKAGCKDTATFEVEIDSQSGNVPKVQITPQSKTVCEGERISFTVTGAESYDLKFIPIEGITIISESGSSEKVYELQFNTVADAEITVTGYVNGCSGRASAKIKVVPYPRFQLNTEPNNIWCTSGVTFPLSTELKATVSNKNQIISSGGRLVYTFEAIRNPSRTTITPDIQNPEQASIIQTDDDVSYRVTVTAIYADGTECSQQREITIKTVAPLALTLNPQILSGCVGEEVRFRPAVQNGRVADFLLTDLEKNYTYESFQSEIVFMLPFTDTIKSMRFRVIATELGSQCTDEKEFTVTVYPNPQLSLPGEMLICKGNSQKVTVGVTPNSNVSSYSYQWQGNIIGAKNTAQVEIKPIVRETYRVNVTATYPDGKSCNSEHSFTAIPTEPDIKLNYSSNKICVGDTVLVTAQPFLTHEPDEDCACNCRWEHPNLISSPKGLAVRAKIGKTTAEQTFTVTCYDSVLQCQTTKKFTIPVVQPPLISVFGNTCIQSNENFITLYAQGADEYRWIPQNAGTVATGKEYRVAYTAGLTSINILLRGKVQGQTCEGETLITVRIAPRKVTPVILSDLQAGQNWVSGSVDLKDFLPYLLAGAVKDLPQVIVYSNGQEVGRTTTDSEGNWTVKTNPVLGECDRITARAFIDGDCSMSISQADESFLSDFTSNKEVRFDRNIKINNAFSPDGDGVNDVFEIVANVSERFPNAKLSVFNRWGASVFEASPYHNDWSGNQLPEGTYFLLFEPNKCDLEPIKSHLTLLRRKK